MFVNGGDGSRNIGRDVDQKGPRRVWKLLQPALGAVQRVYLFGPADLFHDEAGDGAVWRVAQHIDRPGGEIEQPFIAEARQDDEFLGLLRRRRLVINLGHQVAFILNFVDLALRAGSDSPPQSNDVGLGRVEDFVSRANDLCLRGAGNSGHGVTPNQAGLPCLFINFNNSFAIAGLLPFSISYCALADSRFPTHKYKLPSSSRLTVSSGSPFKLFSRL